MAAMIRRRASLLAAAAVLVTGPLTGCGLFGGDDAAPATTAPAPTTTTTEAPTAATEPPELLDPGAEPRQPLRVAYAEGDEAVVSFTSDLQISQDSPGRTQRIDSPPIAQTLRYEVGAVDDDGAELTIRIEAIGAKGKGTGLSDEQLADLDDELAPLVGLEATATATPLGELEDLAFDAPEDLSASLTAQLDALAQQLPALGPALPTEPVGVGASWRSTSTSRVAGAEVETVSTVTVTAIADGTVAYRTTIASTAAPQDLQLAGLADGTTARLTASDVTGSGTGSMGLDHVALTLRTRSSGTQAITLEAGGRRTDLSQTVEIAYVAATEPS